MGKIRKISSLQDDGSRCISIEDAKKIIMNSKKLSGSEKKKAITRFVSNIRLNRNADIRLETSGKTCRRSNGIDS